MTVLAAVAVVLAALYFTLAIRPKDIPEPIPVSPLQHLEDRKRAIYDNLRDLQFEYRLGKLSDGDYQQTKQALQRELALVLSEMEQVSTRLGLSSPPGEPRRPIQKSAPLPAAGTVCPLCKARFPQPLKFCGECGKALA